MIQQIDIDDFTEDTALNIADLLVTLESELTQMEDFGLDDDWDLGWAACLRRTVDLIKYDSKKAE